MAIKVLKLREDGTNTLELIELGVGSGDLLSTNNLSDVADPAAARTNLGAASSDHNHDGVYADLVAGKVPTSQLPAFVDDVIEVANFAALPGTGETGKIYVTQDTNITYRWSGSAYVEISASLALGETAATAYRGDRGKTAYDHSQTGHAPSNAQKNSDITKAEIEAVLTGVIASHSHAGASPPVVATLAADQATGANTTPVTLTGLVFTYEANSKYRIWFMGRVSPAAATTGCGFQFDLSSAVTAITLQFFHQLANTGTQSGGHSIADDASVGVSSGLPGTSNYPVTGEGLLVTGANGGTAQLRFRSETTAVITARAGLTLVIEKIA